MLPEHKALIVQQEIQTLENTIYLLEVRARVAKKVGKPTDGIEKDMEDCERMIDELKTIRAEIETNHAELHAN